MDCPVCGTEQVIRSGGADLFVVDCPSCERLPLWWVGVLALGMLATESAGRVGASVRVAGGLLVRVGKRTVGVLSRSPTS